MDDRKNSSLHKAGFVALSQTANPIASGEVGLYYDGTVLRHQDANANNSPFPINRGVIPSSRVAFSVNPTASDTLAIGSTTFKFVSSLGAATAQVQVKISGVDAAHTLASLVKAINGTASSSEWVEATTPFAVAVVADSVTTQLRIRKATARGGAAVAGTMTSTALTASVSGGASAWTNANLNSHGKADSDVYEACGKVTVTSAMITAGSLYLELPFAPTIVQYQAQSSAGVLRSMSDVVAVSTNAIVITLGGGASPNLQANDVFSWWAAA